MNSSDYLKDQYPKAVSVYPKELSDYFKGDYLFLSDYTPILKSFGKILLQVDDEDYSGDSRVLYEFPDGTYGYLQFGWGSCSGCDALQACDNPEEVEDLIDMLQASIKHFDSAEEGLKYFLEHDWEGDYSWHCKEQKEFIEHSIELFKDIIKYNREQKKCWQKYE